MITFKDIEENSPDFLAYMNEIDIRPGGHPKSPSRGHLKIPQLNA